jgi:LysR family glycine cleavage system transcriptional activator
MQRVPLTQIRALAAVYSAGGIRAAARELGISHSAISRHLADLQDWVGTPLVNNSAREAVSFTAAGKFLAKVAYQSLGEVERAIRSVREQRRPTSVTIVTTSSMAIRWLLPRLARLTAQHPRIELSVLVDQRISEPESQFADLALRMGEGPWAGDDSEPLMDEWLYPVMSAAAWERVGRTTDPACLKSMPLVHDADPGAAWARWLDRYPVSGLSIHAGSRFASSDLVLRAAAQGFGVALARHRLVADEIAAGSLVRPFGDCMVRISNAYWLVVAPGACDRRAVRTVVEWLRSEAEGGGGAS